MRACVRACVRVTYRSCVNACLCVNGNKTVSYHKCVSLSSCQTRTDATWSHGELWFPEIEVTVYVNVASKTFCARDNDSEVPTDGLVRWQRHNHSYSLEFKLLYYL